MKNNREMIGALCGTVLGDSSLQKARKSLTSGGSKNAYLAFSHGKNSEDYFDYKVRIFSEICKVGKSQDIRNGELHAFRAWSRSLPLFTKLHRWFYATGKKIVTDKILYRLTPLGLALWYMDDGYLAYIKKNGKIRGREIKIYTCSFSYEEHLKMVDYFEKAHGIKWRIGKIRTGGKTFYNLATGTEEGVKFFKIINPYIPESMRYKLDLKYSYSSYAGHPLNNSFGMVIQADLGSNVETASEMKAA